MEGRKTERRLKCDTVFVVRVSVKPLVLREEMVEDAMGAAMQLMMMVGCVSNLNFKSQLTSQMSPWIVVQTPEH